jgi:hypothetical protein
MSQHLTTNDLCARWNRAHSTISLWIKGGHLNPIKVPAEGAVPEHYVFGADYIAAFEQGEFFKKAIARPYLRRESAPAKSAPAKSAPVKSAPVKSAGLFTAADLAKRWNVSVGSVTGWTRAGEIRSAMSSKAAYVYVLAEVERYEKTRLFKKHMERQTPKVKTTKGYYASNRANTQGQRIPLSATEMVAMSNDIAEKVTVEVLLGIEKTMHAKLVEFFGDPE